MGNASWKVSIPIVFLSAVIVILVVIAMLVPTSLLPLEPKYEGKPLSYWMVHWYSGSKVDIFARPAVREIGTNGLPFYVTWMETPTRSSSEPHYQAWALRGFEVLGPKGKPAIPELIRILSYGGNYPALALAAIGKDSIPALTNFLSTNIVSSARRKSRWMQPWRAKSDALLALQILGTNAEPALPTMLSLLQKPAGILPGEVVEAVSEVGKHRPDIVVPALTEAVTNKAFPARGSAARALGNFGAAAESAVPVLLTASRDDDAAVRTWASAALRQVKPDAPDVLRPLIENLTNRIQSVRQEALSALDLLGTNGAEALDVLLARGVCDRVPHLLAAAIGCVAKIGICNADVLAALVTNLSHTNPTVQTAAIGAIVSFAPHSQGAFEALLLARHGYPREVISAARNNAVIIGTKNPSLLQNSLSSPDPEVRYNAFQVMYYEVEVPLEAAVPALLRAVSDPDERIRGIATNTLRDLDLDRAASQYPKMR